MRPMRMRQNEAADGEMRSRRLGSASSESAIERLEPPEEVHGPMRPAWQGRRGPTVRSRGCGGQKGEISSCWRYNFLITVSQILLAQKVR